MTTTTWATTTRPSFSLGQLINDTLSTLAATAGPLALATLIFVAAPQALAGLLPENLHGISFVAGLPALIGQGGAVMIAYSQLSGRPITLGAAISQASSRFGALWGLSILSGLGIMVGLLLLVGPGIFLMAAWMVAQPALLVEGVGVTVALERSMTLTKGARWPLVAAVGLCFVALIAVLIVLVVAIFGFTALLGASASKLLEAIVLTPLFTAAFTALCSVGAAAAYVQLKRARDGALHGEVADVFS